MQRTRVAAEWCTSAWLNSLGKGQHADMGRRERDLKRTTYLYLTQRVLILWKASQELPSG